MSIPVVIGKGEMKTIEKELRKNQDILCLDAESFVKTNLVALDRLYRGLTVNAKVVKGY